MQSKIIQPPCHIHLGPLQNLSRVFFFSLQRPLMDTIVNDLESDTHVSIFNF